MSDSLDHLIRIEASDRQELDLGALVEATGLFLNCFVEGDSLANMNYDFRVECESPWSYLIKATLRHPIANNRFELDRAFCSLYLVFAGWNLAGASVEALGPWRSSFPSGGTCKASGSDSLRPQVLFQLQAPSAQPTKQPSMETLAEIYANLPHQANWDQLVSQAEFRKCFTQITPHATSVNDVRLQHRHGWQVDVVLSKGHINSHIFVNDQTGIDCSFSRLACERQCSQARTWWDAWVGFCPTGNLKPSRLLFLPNEVAILSVSGSIWRYQIKDKSTLECPWRIDFGPGFHPSRTVEFWLQLANRYGEAKHFEIAIACCEQAMLTAIAMRDQSAGLAISPTIGKSPRALLNDAETEYLRWCDCQESLTQPSKPHDNWLDEIVSGGVHELTVFVGERWESAIGDVVDALNSEHHQSESCHRKIGRIREFAWHVDGDYGTLKYYRLFGRELMDSKLPKAATAVLGYSFREDIIPSHIDFEDIFTLWLGESKFWGSAEHRVLICCTDPRRAFFI